MGLITVFKIQIVACQYRWLVGRHGFGNTMLDLGLFVVSL